MKLCKTTYLSLFFLFCFTASFSVNTIQNLRTSIHKADPSYGKSSRLSAAEAGSTSSNSILLEKNENEIEKSLILQSFLLPFYSSVFRSELAQPDTHASGSPATLRIRPVYLVIRHFRI